MAIFTWELRAWNICSRLDGRSHKVAARLTSWCSRLAWADASPMMSLRGKDALGSGIKAKHTATTATARRRALRTQTLVPTTLVSIVAVDAVS